MVLIAGYQVTSACCDSIESSCNFIEAARSDQTHCRVDGSLEIATVTSSTNPLYPTCHAVSAIDRVLLLLLLNHIRLCQATCIPWRVPNALVFARTSSMSLLLRSMPCLEQVASDTRTGELGGRVIFRRRFACSHKKRTSSGTAAGLSRWKRGFVQIMGLVR